jgi:hypothetical protein
MSNTTRSIGSYDTDEDYGAAVAAVPAMKFTSQQSEKSMTDDEDFAAVPRTSLRVALTPDDCHREVCTLLESINITLKRQIQILSALTDATRLHHMDTYDAQKSSAKATCDLLTMIESNSRQ